MAVVPLSLRLSLPFTGLEEVVVVVVVVVALNPEIPDSCCIDA